MSKVITQLCSKAFLPTTRCHPSHVGSSVDKFMKCGEKIYFSLEYARFSIGSHFLQLSICSITQKRLDAHVPEFALELSLNTRKLNHWSKSSE